MLLNAKWLYFKVAGVFAATLAVGAAVVFLVEQNEVAKRKQAAVEVAALHGHLLQEQTARSLSATYALAAVLKQGNGRIDSFGAIAEDMLALYGGISALQLAPGGVIRQVVPLRGNEAAIGHDLLADPARNKEAFTALETRRLTLAGPFQLRQGGVAVVGRLPVFLLGPSGEEFFWGFATALIRIPDLLAASKLGESASSEYRYELSRIHPDSGRRDVFWASAGEPLRDPLSYRIEVPNGEWHLSLAPVGGWHSSPTPLGLAALVVLLFGALAGFAAFRVFREPYLLARQVAERTAELSQANASLQTEIIEHWRAEQALRESESRLEARVEERTAQLAAANAALQEEAARQAALVERLEDAQNQLLQAEMMASIGRLAAGVAHEINNPIGFINSNLGMLKKFSAGLLEIAGLAEAPDAAEPGDALGVALARLDLPYVREELPQLFVDTQEGVSRIKRIVQSLKAFSHVDDTDWRSCDLEQGIDCTLEVLAADRPAGVEIVRERGDVPPCECLALHVNLLFYNLLLNAFQAMPGGGRLRLATSREGEGVRIEVADSGCGIAPEHLGCIFDPFFTTRPVGEGSGLGLSLCYGIVKRHGGRIEVDSRPGEGSLFRVWLPAARRVETAYQAR